MHPFLSIPLCLVIGGYMHFYIKVYLARRKFQKENHCLPPPRLPQIDRILGIGTMRENVDCWRRKRYLSLLKSRFDRIGRTFSARVAGDSFIYTMEPENFKAILAEKFEDFDVGWHRLRAMRPVLGEVLITTDGARWHHQRGMLRPAFNRRQISDYRFFKPDIDTLISKIPRDRSTTNLAPLFNTHAINLATRLLFDEPMSTLNPEFDSKPERFVNAIRETNRGMELRLRAGRFLPLMPTDRPYEAAKEILHEYADAFVRKAMGYRKRWEHDGAEGHENGEDRYVFLRELAKESEDSLDLRNNMLGMLLVGSESTASFLTSSLWVLSNRQDLWAQMRSEVLNIEEGELTYERMKTLTTLNYVMNEVLRLHPVLPVSARIANKDTFLPTGGGPDGRSHVFVPKNTIVQVHFQRLHRSKDIFGLDADEFKPERWASAKSLGFWDYLPFSGGPRVCVGQQYALMEVSYTLVRLLQEFSDIESRDPDPWLEQIGISATNGNGAKVGLTPAQPAGIVSSP